MSSVYGGRPAVVAGAGTLPAMPYIDFGGIRLWASSAGGGAPVTVVLP